MSKKIIFLNSHPIQYYVPLYQFLNSKSIDLEVWYCDDSSVKGKKDEGFGQNIVWDIPLLEGYSSTFFKNQALNSSTKNSFFGIINFNLIIGMLKTKKSIFVINGWQFFTYVMAAFIGKLRGHELWMRCEMPWNQEVIENTFFAKAKRFFLKNIYFKCFTKFLYIGKQNKLFYKKMGVRKTKLFFTPYAVDNERFNAAYHQLKNKKEALRKQYNIPVQSKIILYSGKYITKKNPMDLLQAFHHAQISDKYLIFLGDGELRKEMETYINKYQINNVLLTGFVNQSEIVNYYAIADLFVMCSGVGETWGLSVNEAMNFRLPVIVSNTIGSSFDLIQEAKNGYIFDTGNIKQLSNELESTLNNNTFMSTAGDVSYKVINGYSFNQIEMGIRKALEVTVS